MRIRLSVGLYGIVAGLLFIFGPMMSDAYAQCPSNYYFRADSSEALAQFETKLNSSVCLSIATRTTQINAKAVVTVQVADTKKLQQALIDKLVGAGSCAYDGVSGWDVTGIDVSFAGLGSAARVRLNVTGRDCLYRPLKGERLTYEAPVSVSVKGNEIAVVIDTDRSKLTFTRTGGSVPLLFGALARRIGTALNNAIGSPLDLTSYISASTLGYARELNPVITQAAFTLQSNKLLLKVYLSGQVNKPDADRLLGQTVRDDLIPRFLRWIATPRGLIS